MTDVKHKAAAVDEHAALQMQYKIGKGEVKKAPLHSTPGTTKTTINKIENWLKQMTIDK